MVSPSVTHEFHPLFEILVLKNFFETPTCPSSRETCVRTSHTRPPPHPLFRHLSPLCRASGDCKRALPRPPAPLCRAAAPGAGAASAAAGAARASVCFLSL